MWGFFCLYRVLFHKVSPAVFSAHHNDADGVLPLGNFVGETDTAGFKLKETLIHFICVRVFLLSLLCPPRRI